MEMREFRELLKRAMAFFNVPRTRIVEGAVEEWYREVKGIPGDRIEVIIDGLKAEEDSFPRNFPMAVKKYAYRGSMKAGGNSKEARIYSDCPDCDGHGMIHVGRINESRQYTVYVFRCLKCHQADGDLAAQGQYLQNLLADGWEVDNVEATIRRQRNKPANPGGWRNPAIAAAQKAIELKGESAWRA